MSVGNRTIYGYRRTKLSSNILSTWWLVSVSTRQFSTAKEQTKSKPFAECNVESGMKFRQFQLFEWADIRQAFDPLNGESAR